MLFGFKKVYSFRSTKTHKHCRASYTEYSYHVTIQSSAKNISVISPNQKALLALFNFRRKWNSQIMLRATQITFLLSLYPFATKKKFTCEKLTNAADNNDEDDKCKVMTLIHMTILLVHARYKRINLLWLNNNKCHDDNNLSNPC